MDASLFGSSSPGRLVKIFGDDRAFIPNPLPPDWAFPADLWPLLAEAKAKVALLEGVGRTLPNPSLLLKPLARREAIQSSKIEGTYATPKELLLFEMEPTEAKAGDDRTNDRQEVNNYRLALDHATTSDLPLSLRLIREMHGILLQGVRGRDKMPGEFRKVPVAIGTNRRFMPPPAEQIQSCLGDLEKYVNVGQHAHDPLVVSFLTHYQFETIHPFMDGNGRVGRLLLAVMIQQLCSLSKPWLYLSEYFERHREEYCQRLFDVSAKSDWRGWMEFCLRGAIEQADATVKRCDRLQKVRATFLKRIAGSGGNTRLIAIIDELFNSPIVGVAQLAKKLRVTYPTAKADVAKLTMILVLRELKKASPKAYFSPDVYAAAYSDIE
jgi:Fic family protein